MNNTEGFYENYVTESNGTHGDEIRRLEKEADRIAEQINDIEEMNETESPNHGDVVRLATLNAQLEELDEKILSLQESGEDDS